MKTDIEVIFTAAFSICYFYLYLSSYIIIEIFSFVRLFVSSFRLWISTVISSDWTEINFRRRFASDSFIQFTMLPACSCSVLNACITFTTFFLQFIISSVSLLEVFGFHHRHFLPARRYASAGLCDSDVSVRPSVRLSVCLDVRLSHAGIVPSRAKAGS